MGGMERGPRSAAIWRKGHPSLPIGSTKHTTGCRTGDVMRGVVAKVGTKGRSCTWSTGSVPKHKTNLR